MRQARPGEEDLIIVGDFNLVKANMEAALGGRRPAKSSSSAGTRIFASG